MMNPIQIRHNNKTSDIYIKESLEGLTDLLLNRKTIVVIDENVNNLYPTLFAEFPRIIVQLGEQNKNMETVAYIYEQLIEMEADRHTFLLGVGGGITSDVVGFVAATFMRGIEFGFVATTLMAQVDASIGGKNGVNFNRYKNMVGTFTQPAFVWCDARFLTTLSPRERNAGFAEIIKYGLIWDETILQEIENCENILTEMNLRLYTSLITKCAAIKAQVVNMDAQEKGLRKILNFGHTFGHALEKFSSKYNHGEAVSIGMVIALKLSVKIAELDIHVAERAIAILEKTSLPTVVSKDLFPQITEFISMDKKRNESNMDFVVLRKIGEAAVVSIDLNTLKTRILECQ